MDKYLETARNLKALAERGLGGEAVNAQKILDHYMKKYGLTPDMVQGDKKEAETFKVKEMYGVVFLQVVANTIGKRYLEGRQLRDRKYVFIFDITKLEKIEIEIKFDFFKNAYDEALKLFNHAFIQKNNLFSIDEETADVSKMSEEDLLKAQKVLAMAKNIEKTNYAKQLNKG